MTRTDITVPDMNDSFSKVTLDGAQYYLRFTWNDTAGRWSFGVYTILKEPIVQGLKIVPRFPLNLQYADERLPPGAFGVFTKLAVVGRDDFKGGKAAFAYVTAD